MNIFSKVAAEYDTTILSTVNRITRYPSLPSLAHRIATLPLSCGGLGYRTWSSIADSAFLAAYTNAAEKFPTLFPDKPYLATRTPHPSNFNSIPSRPPPRPNLPPVHCSAYNQKCPQSSKQSAHPPSKTAAKHPGVSNMLSLPLSTKQRPLLH